MKAHIKRQAIPITWDIKRKKVRFVARPLPGGSFNFSVPLVVVFRDILKKAKTSKEVKTILLNNEIFVNGARVKEIKHLIGLMDVISIPSTDEHFRVLVNKKNRLELVPIAKDESEHLLCKIVKKSLVKGKGQLNLHNGRNVLVDNIKDYKVGDSVLLVNNAIKEHIKLEKGCQAYLIGGKHIGRIAKINDVKEGAFNCVSDKESWDVIKKHVFVVGKDKAAISLLE